MAEALRVTTESGTVYEITGTYLPKREGARLISVDPDGYARRSGGGAMRGDGQWLRLLGCDLVVGQGMRQILVLPEECGAIQTLRMTTPVVSIDVVKLEDGPTSS